MAFFGHFNYYYSNTGHCYEHLKNIYYNENWASDMDLNVCVCDEFLSSQKCKKIKFLTFQPQPVWVRVISSIILYVNVILEKFQW